MHVGATANSHSKRQTKSIIIGIVCFFKTEIDLNTTEWSVQANVRTVFLQMILIMLTRCRTNTISNLLLLHVEIVS